MAATAAFRPVKSLCSRSPTPHALNRHEASAAASLMPAPRKPRPRAALIGSSGRSPHPTRASSLDGIPSEVVEDPKFVPLNADDPVYGPPALLLSGFEADETDKIKQLLKELDGEFLKIIHCTEEMISQSVWDAVHTEQPSLENVKIARSTPRMCILSGLSGEEMMMFIDAFPESGLEPSVFAALVPNSANKRLGDVMEEIIGDHEMLSAKQST